jgi:uncharacterized protein YqjF (DUF2071 family)
MFKDTKVLGVSFPFHQNFEEVNLRIYVKQIENGETKRGVVFIKEIVPKKLISVVANTIYKEHYFTTKMNHEIVIVENDISVNYGWENKKDEQFINVKASPKPLSIKQNSVEEFIAEHYWGYTKISDNKTSRYEVKHPSWNQHKVINFSLQIDFNKNYGDDFECLNNQKPHSVFLFDGSEISVGNKQVIK